MTDFSNEFDLNDDVDRHVAIAEGARIRAEIKSLEKDLEWFTKNFREYFKEKGGEETGHNGATVKVNQPNDPKPSLDTKKLESKFPVEKFPQYYNLDDNGDVKYTTRAAAVTFKK